MNRTLQSSPSAMIKTGIWEDEEFIDRHSVENRFVLLYLLTCPFRHVSGIVKSNYRIMSGHLGWDKQQTQIVIDRLQSLDEIAVSGVFIWVKSHFDHNSYPSPTHHNQINSRLQEISPELLKIWLEDATQRGIAVDKIYKSTLGVICDQPIGTPELATSDPNDKVALNNNNNNNHNNSSNNKDNHHNHNNSSVVSELTFPSKLDSRLQETIGNQLKGRFDAQEILDELAAGLAKGRINSPSLWIGGVINNGLTRSSEGLQMEDKRKAMQL